MWLIRAALRRPITILIVIAGVALMSILAVKLQAVRAQQAEAQVKMVSAQSTYDRLKAASATPGVVAGNDLEIAETPP